jgi:FkbM family methyltransferase
MMDFRQMIAKHNLNITGILHCGANDGQERFEYDELKVPVAWIEALPAVYAKLQENLTHFPLQRCFNICIGDEDGKEVVFHVSNNQAQSSSYLELGTHKDIHPEVHYVQDIPMKTTRLDTFFDYLGVVKPLNFLMLDLQGAELIAMKSLGEYLDQFDYIWTEVNQVPVYESCPLIGDLDMFLMGYVRVETGNWVAGSWTDALYVKKELL